MLVSQLYGLFRKNVPKQERAIVRDDECRTGEGIWDILGYYDSKSYLITICEPKVKRHSKQLAMQPKFEETLTRLTLRELVRLHEHAHAMLHTGNFGGGIRRRFKMGYRNFPLNINEPLTEFIAWSVVRNVGVQSFENVFNEVDKNAPNYYRIWDQIKQLIESKDKPDRENYVFFVPGLIQVAREGIWKNFGQFLQGVKDHYLLIKKLAVLEGLGLSKSSC